MGRIYKFLLVFGALAAANILFAGDASALGSTFPNSANNPDGVKFTAMVSEAGAGVTLNAREARFRIFIDPDRPGPVQVTIIGACDYDTRFNDVGNMSFRAGIGGVGKENTPGECNGSNDLVFNVPKGQFSTGPSGPNGQKTYGPFLSELLVVRKINGPGIKSFKVHADNAYVTFDEDVPLPNAYLGGDPFSVWNGSPGDPPTAENDFEFQFKLTPCNYDRVQDIWLNWQDADYGESNELGNDIRWRLIRDSTGNAVASSSGPAIGGNGSFRDENVGKLWMNESFTWRWENVDKINGIQIYMPFSEISLIADCQTAEDPAANASCRYINLNMNGTNRRYRIYVNDNGTSGVPAAGAIDYSGVQDDYRQFDLYNDNKFVSGTLQYTIQIYNGTTIASGVYDTISDTRVCNAVGNGGCTVNVTPHVPIPGAPVNAVRAGGGFTVTVTIANAGTNTLAASQWINGAYRPLSATLLLDGKWQPPSGVASGNLAPFYFSSSINPGSSVTRAFNQTAPGGQGVHNITLYPDYWGAAGLNNPAGQFSACTAQIQTYEYFQFQPYSNPSVLLPDAENPSSAQLVTGVRKITGPDVSATTSRQWYKKLVSGALVLIGGTFNDPRTYQDVEYPDVYTINPPESFQLGESYCASITMDRASGWVGPAGYFDWYPATASTSCNPGVSPTIINRPYIRTYGADVLAGGGFGTSCSATNSGILAYLSPLGSQAPSPSNPPGSSGSGTSLAAMALGPISGFMSAATRQSGPQSPQGLTFAHTNTLPTQTGNNPVLGGNMAGDGWCSPDYYETTQFIDDANKTTNNSNSPLNIMSLNDGEQTVKQINGAMIRIMGPGAANYNRKHTVYVDGDAFIDSNIMYDQSVYNNIETIPSFTLIVKGNIYIDRNVSQLDGLYIAQPRSGNPNSGRIYTCALGAPSFTAVTAPAAIYNECGGNDAGSRRQLTVNGAFIAQKLILNRAGYTLRDSTYREMYSPTARAAETFVFNPEMFLSPPVFRPSGTATGGDYQSIQILAPFL